jgi:hypothetical protein
VPVWLSRKMADLQALRVQAATIYSITSTILLSFGSTMTTWPPMIKNRWDLTCDTLEATSAGMGCREIDFDTTSPTPRWISGDEFSIFKSLIISLISCRCSSDKLIFEVTIGAFCSVGACARAIGEVKSKDTAAAVVMRTIFIWLNPSFFKMEFLRCANVDHPMFARPFGCSRATPRIRALSP